MDPKLAILFLLISSVIGLSHLNDENLEPHAAPARRPALARIRAGAAQILGKVARV